MAELTPDERLQPSLLDRLTDEHPERKQESRDQRVLTTQRLREGVIRDLSWLFNCGDMADEELAETYPFVARSVLNYGMPDLTGRTASGVDPKTVEQMVRRAILDFEPRLVPETVKVRAEVRSGKMAQNAVNFVIEGQLWAEPMPLELYLKTELDLETGSVAVEETSGR